MGSIFFLGLFFYWNQINKNIAFIQLNKARFSGSTEKLVQIIDDILDSKGNISIQKDKLLPYYLTINKDLQNKKRIELLLQNKTDNNENDELYQYWYGYFLEINNQPYEAVSYYIRVNAIFRTKSIGEEVIENEDWSNAKLIYQLLSKNYPNDCYVTKRYADIFYLGFQDYEMAENLYFDAISICKDDFATNLQLARLLIDQKQFIESEKILFNIIREFSEEELPISILALSKLRQNDYEGTISMLIDYLHKESSLSEIHGILANALLLTQDYETAVKQSKLALSINPDQEWYYEILLSSLRHSGSKYELQKECSNALSLFPNSISINNLCNE